MEEQVVARENVVAGTVGALLFSLAGGVVWFLLYQVGFFAGISGLVGVICAIKGYAVFAKQESLKGIVISVVLATLVMVASWYLCLALDVYNAYQEWYAAGEVDFTVTYAEAVRGAYMFFEEPEIRSAYIKDLLIGLALCAVGAYRYVTDAIKRIKQGDQAPQQPQAAPEESAGQPQESAGQPQEPAAEQAHPVEDPKAWDQENQ